jgi:ribonuclease BN (tRNA processing enzyme)
VIDLRIAGFFIVVVFAITSWIATCAAWHYDEVAEGVKPLDPREFSRLTVVAVGTGGAHENHLRRGPCIAVGHGDRIWLFDAGRGTADGLRASGISPAQPDVVHLTHLLPENTVGLAGLWFSRWLAGADGPLRLVGPPGTRALAEGIYATHVAGLAARARAFERPPAPPFEVVEVDGAWETAEPGLAIRALSLPGGPLAAVAYRVESDASPRYGARSVAISGAGWRTEALPAFARGADLLVHEAVAIPTAAEAEEYGIEDTALLDRERTVHTTLDQAGALARDAEVGALALVRLRPPPVFDLQVSGVIDDAFSGALYLPEDGDEITP